MTSNKITSIRFEPEPVETESNILLWIMLGIFAVGIILNIAGYGL